MQGYTSRWSWERCAPCSVLRMRVCACDICCSDGWQRFTAALTQRKRGSRAERSRFQRADASSGSPPQQQSVRRADSPRRTSICLAGGSARARLTESLQAELSVVFSLNETLEHVAGTVRLNGDLQRRGLGGGEWGVSLVDSALPASNRLVQLTNPSMVQESSMILAGVTAASLGWFPGLT